MSLRPCFERPDMRLYLGDCLEVMRAMPAESVVAVVTDPPYGLEFMGKEWDRLWQDRPNKAARRVAGDRSNAINRYHDIPKPAYVAGPEAQAWHEAWAREALRVLKPGGHLVAFGGSRTHHRLFCAIEDAGFECRDTLVWLFASGFPKHSSALKPAAEFICLARKPLAERTVAANVLAHRCGALNIDACRLQRAEGDTSGWHTSGADGTKGYQGTGTFKTRNMPAEEIAARCGGGRWPANCCLSHSPECEQVGTRRVRANSGWDDRPGLKSRGGILNVTDEPRNDAAPNYTDADGTEEVAEWRCAPGCAVRMLDEQAGVRTSGAYRGGPRKDPGTIEVGFKWCLPTEGSSGNASRFFFTAKASRSERTKTNSHPTVKPLALMRWLCQLITPPGGTVLDPFLGSGTTALAARAEGFKFIGIEKEEEYLAMAVKRLAQEVLPLESEA